MKNATFLSNVASLSSKNKENNPKTNKKPTCFILKSCLSSIMEEKGIKLKQRYCSIHRKAQPPKLLLPKFHEGHSHHCSFIYPIIQPTNNVNSTTVSSKAGQKKMENPILAFYSLHIGNSPQKGKKKTLNPRQTLLRYTTKSQILMQSSRFCTAIVSGPNFNIHLPYTFKLLISQ